MIVPIPGDRPVHVVHGDATARRAIVYLHGLCGDIYAMRDWAHRARRFGTVIGLLGDEACGGERFRWSQWVPGIHARIRRALEVVAEQRRGLLDPEPLTVVGYSQGSVRAAMLVQRYPETYREVVAAGMPVAPRPDRVGLARSIAVVGGEREPTAHMRSGTDALLQANKRARFFMLPGAAHGEYGPEGAPIMESVLEWLYEAAP